MEHFLEGIAPLKTQIRRVSWAILLLRVTYTKALASKKCSIKVPTKGKTTF